MFKFKTTKYIYIYIYFNWNKYWSTFVSSIFFPQKKEFEKPNI